MKRLLIVLMLIILPIVSFADQQAWIICQPGDWVNARSRASSHSSSEGSYYAGDCITVDGEEKAGFTHVVDSSFEVSECWVASGYVSYSEPIQINARATVISKGRVRARKCIDGKRRKWLEGGERLQVYYLAGDWAVTSEGFVQREFLRIEGID